jgi:hypothetical protein
VSDDRIVDLIDQLLAESDLEKQKTILRQVSSLLAEERDQRKKKTARASSE